VSFYLAFSPLPVPFSKNRRYVFCDTFRQRPLSRTLPAYFTRHAAVWCSDFPPVNPTNAGLTSDHLPSAHSLTQPVEKKTTPNRNKAGSRYNQRHFLADSSRRVSAQWVRKNFFLIGRKRSDVPTIGRSVVIICRQTTMKITLQNFR